MGWLGLDILAALESGILTAKNLAVALDSSPGAIRRACQNLHKRGLIYATVGCVGGLYELTDAGRSALSQGQEFASGPVRGSVRRPNSLRTRAWRAMRIKRKFSVPELCGMLCDGTSADPEGNLEQYVLPLARAGYLADLPRMMDGTPRYLLVKDTGPLAPAWNKQRRCLTDPNTGEQITLEGRYGRRVAASAGAGRDGGGVRGGSAEAGSIPHSHQPA